MELYEKGIPIAAHGNFYSINDYYCKTIDNNKIDNNKIIKKSY